MTSLNICRACQSTRIEMFLPLGDHPPANAFLRADRLDQAERVYPLDTCVCLDCALIQVADHLPADFFRDYVYVPSASATMHSHFREFAGTVNSRLISSADQLVVDIGCNDGLFLASCQSLGVRTLGIDPASNIAEMARAKGLEVFNEYFSVETARTALERWGPAQVITTTNTFNHIDDLHGFVAGVVILLADDGTFIIEVPQALTCVEHTEFDTVYHEHLSVFSVTSLDKLGAFFGLEVVEVQELPIHGGSMRVFLRRSDRTTTTPSAANAPALWRDKERAANLFDAGTYRDMAQRVHAIRDELMVLLRALKANGKHIVGYGAPAKGNTLLNFYGIGSDMLDYLADLNPLKQGLYSPGQKIPVVSPDRIEETKPDYLLILAWNFADEIIAQQQAHARRGGKFIIPIPRPIVV